MRRTSVELVVFLRRRNLIFRPFATHLPEGGTGLCYIQFALGHRQTKSTEIYTHVANRDLIWIRSPLDQLLRPEDGER